MENGNGLQTHTRHIQVHIDQNETKTLEHGDKARSIICMCNLQQENRSWGDEKDVEKKS